VPLLPVKPLVRLEVGMRLRDGLAELVWDREGNVEMLSPAFTDSLESRRMGIQAGVVADVPSAEMFDVAVVAVSTAISFLAGT